MYGGVFVVVLFLFLLLFFSIIFLGGLLWFLKEIIYKYKNGLNQD